MRIRRHLLRIAAVCAGFALALIAVPAALASPLVVIDPGHGGPWSNANSNGLKEKNVNLAISLALRDELTARGYRVVLTRETDTAVASGDISTWNWNSASGLWSFRRDGRVGLDGGIPQDDLQARADVANRLGADLFVCVHANGSVRRTVRGFETYSSARDAQGGVLGDLVQRAVVRRTRIVDRGAHRNDYYVLRWTNMPAILVECGYISSPSDAALLKRSDFRSRVATGIAEGVDAWFASGAPSRTTLRRVTASGPTAFSAAVSAASFPTGAPVAIVARSDR
ncbi:MAG: N-acetylmuramoyl-L-alanine amidase, partial [Actinobacteria bacterium]